MTQFDGLDSSSQQLLDRVMVARQLTSMGVKPPVQKCGRAFAVMDDIEPTVSFSPFSCHCSAAAMAQFRKLQARSVLHPCKRHFDKLSNREHRN